MRFHVSAVALAATASALVIGERASDDQYVIELAPGVTKVVTEAEKWALKAEGKHFFDITAEADHGHPTSKSLLQNLAVTYPGNVEHNDTVHDLITKLDQANFKKNLQPFSDFHNRYYKSDNGKKSSEWLQQQIKGVIDSSSAKGVTVQPFSHSWPQSSIIVTVPGKSEKKVVLGAHQDSINQMSPSSGRAPGADDDGSGVVTILETLRVLLQDSKVAAGEAPNSIEFHFYAAEEGGLLGSQDIFRKYSQDKKQVVAMLQQDMTGYTKGTTEKGKDPIIGVLTDNVDDGLTAFLKKVIDAYCEIGWVESQCGYACSDHASATKYGYPSSFAFESAFGDDSPYIHSADDTIETVDFDHVLQHARLSLGFAYELGFASL